MSESFLTRWSRLKREPEQPASEPPASADADSAPAEPAQADDPASAAVDASEAAPDLSALPPIESITAETDIRAFLTPGVPAQLTRAALRRAWSSDPAIRDFVGLSENAWDFNAPDAMPGFGPLAPSDAIRRMAANLFGKGEQEPSIATSSTTEKAESPQVSEPLPRDADERIGASEDAASSAEEPASSPDDTISSAQAGTADEPDDQPTAVRSHHGGALPR